MNNVLRECTARGQQSWVARAVGTVMECCPEQCTGTRDMELAPQGGWPRAKPREAPLHLDVVPSSGGLTRGFDPHCSAPARAMVNPASHCLCGDQACGSLSTPCSHVTMPVAAGPWRFSGCWVLAGFRTGLGSKLGFSRPGKLADKEEGLWKALCPLPNLTHALPYLLWSRSHWWFWK